MPAGTSRVLLTIPLDRLVALLHTLDDHARCLPDAACRDAGYRTVPGGDDGLDPLNPPSPLPRPGTTCTGTTCTGTTCTGTTCTDSSTPTGAVGPTSASPPSALDPSPAIDPLDLPGYGPVSGQPARLATYGPLADDVALRMFQHHLDQPGSEQALVITGTDGRVIGYHKLDQRTLRGLRRDVLIAQSGSCVFPTCRHSPLECQGDHGKPYAQLRRTLLDNMNPTCPSHHAAKSAGAYRVTPVSPGEWELILRSGHTYGSSAGQATGQ